jgi:hypothetical protein
LPEAIAHLDAALASAPKDITVQGVNFRRARLATDDALHRRDDASVQLGLHAMLSALRPDRPMERVIYNAQAAIVASSRNNAETALNHIDHMNRALVAAQCPPSISAIHRTREGAIFLGMERYALAVRAFETATSNVPDSQSAVPIGYAALTRALEAMQQGDGTWHVSTQRASELREGLAAVRCIC